MKILHVFYNFLPDVSGSSVRSSGLVAGQVAQGMDLAIISSPFQPGFGDAPVETWRGIPVHRSFRAANPRVSERGASLLGRLKKALLFPRFVVQIIQAGRSENATVLHAHSTFFCGLAAYFAGRWLRVKVVYEFRSLWEERSRGLNLGYRLQARVSRALETLSLSLADRVVAINQGLREEVISRGIPAGKVDVVPNAVDAGLLLQGEQLIAPRHIRRFGYIGNFSHIEGLDVLVEAFGLAFPNGEDVRLSFHGIGAYTPELATRIKDAGDPRIQLHGAFTRDQVMDVYASVDCVVIPRRRLKINETVTPLKPLEAMAFKRLVGISDVAGLIEVVASPENAWVFKADDAGELALALRRIHQEEGSTGEMAHRGHRFVQEERSWDSVARAYHAVYEACEA